MKLIDDLQDENKRWGVIGTTIFHLFLLLLFVFATIPHEEDPFEDALSVQLALGDSDVGSGDADPTETGEVEEVTEEVVEQEVQPEPVTPSESIHTQEVSETSIKTSEEPIEKKDPEIDRRLKEKVLNNSDIFKKKKAETGTNSGPGDDPGVFGKPDGTPGGKSLNGGVGGGDRLYSLKGRKILSAPPVDDDLQESGKITVDIIVDRQGRVVKVSQALKGTTITNGRLIQKALEAARKAKFSANKDAPEEQKGTITYVFILE